MSNPPALTKFAQKYGVLEVDTNPPYFRRRGKSGYTPTEPRTVLTPAPQVQRSKWIDYVQETCLLKGVNARQLQDLGTFPDKDARSNSSLSNHMNPLFHLTQWEKPSKGIIPGRTILPITQREPCYTFGGTNTGLWTASNPSIWRALKPCLRLASRILDSIHTLPWFDAFLFGEFRLLPAELDGRPTEVMETDPPLCTFHLRSPDTRNTEETLARKQDLFMFLRERVLFGIGSMLLEGRTNMVQSTERLQATTMAHIDPLAPKVCQKVAVSLSYEIILPLLRNDMSPSEVLTEQFLVALTIVHEIAHTINYALIGSDLHPSVSLMEPYFETEKTSELGFSLETVLLGGSTLPFVINTKGFPHLGTFTASYPSRGFIFKQPVIGGVASLPQQTHFAPIPSKHLENLQTDQFWNVPVAKMGLDVVKADTGGFYSTVEELSPRVVSTTQTIAPFLQLPWRPNSDQAGTAIQLLLKSDPDGRHVIANSVETARETRERLELVNFRIEQHHVVDQIMHALRKVEEHVQAFGRRHHETESARQHLLELLDKESQLHVFEILKFSKMARSSNAECLTHLRFLSSLNLHPRDKISHESMQSANSNNLDHCRRITVILQHSYEILNTASGNSEAPVSPIPTTLTEFMISCGAATVSDPAEPIRQNDVATADELEKALDALNVQGKEAVAKKDLVLCCQLGTRLVLESLFHSFYRSVGYLLLAIGDPEDALGAYPYKAIEGLQSLPIDYPHRDYEYWLHLAESEVQLFRNKKRLASHDIGPPCPKRRKVANSTADFIYM